MANGEAPNTGWTQATTAVGQFDTSSVSCRGGVLVFSTSAFCYGNRSDITFNTNAVTDGAYVPANTYVFIPPGFWPTVGKPNLNTLYHRAGGTVNISIVYLP